MSGDHNEYQKDKSYLDFECPRCGHCCQAEWVGLTDEEIWSNGSRLSLSESGIREFARAIEAKLKEKNQ
jgi:Fe-S-cluster containining protein